MSNAANTIALLGAAFVVVGAVLLFAAAIIRMLPEVAK